MVYIQTLCHGIWNFRTHQKTAMADVNPLDYLAIKNVLARYCQALDCKDFDSLSNVFMSDVDADYPFNSELKSLDEVKTAIKERYSSLPQQKL
jgi:hypothetical protein